MATVILTELGILSLVTAILGKLLVGRLGAFGSSFVGFFLFFFYFLFDEKRMISFHNSYINH